MAITSEFIVASAYALDNKLEGQFISNNKESSFRVVQDEKGVYKLAYVMLKDMEDKFTIDENSVEVFIEEETKRYQRFVEDVKEEARQYIGSTMQKGLSLNDLLDYLADNWHLEHKPLSVFKGSVVGVSNAREVRILNNGTSVTQVVLNEGIFENAIRNTLDLERNIDKENKVVAGILRYIEVNHENDTVTLKVELAQEFVDVVNMAL